MVASAASFMAPYASTAGSDFFSSDEDAVRSVTTAAQSFSFLSCAPLVRFLHLEVVVQLRELGAAIETVVCHVDDLGAAQRRTNDVASRTRPPDAGSHHDLSTVVSPATAGKTTVTTSDSWAHNL